MTKEELIDIISKYTDLKNEAEERLRIIKPEASVEEIAAYNGALDIYYSYNWVDDNEWYDIELPYEFLTAAPGEEFNAVVNAYYAEERRKEEEREKKRNEDFEERERAEYERLKKKFGG